MRSLGVATELLCKKVSNLEKKSLKHSCGGGILKCPWRINKYEGFFQIKLFVFYFIELDEQLFVEHLTN